MASARDHDLARFIAEEAGQRLVRLREEQAPAVDDKDAVRAFAALADRSSDDWILSRLRDEFPGDAILSEETEDDFARLEAERVWIIDPVDGTWEFSHGRDDWAVHVALWEKGIGLTAGTVAVPGIGETWSTARPMSLVNLDIPTHRAARVVVSRTRPLRDEQQFIAALTETLAPLGVPEVTLVRVGSVGAKVGEVLAGRVDAYVSETGFYEWDGAAPEVVALHAGLDVSDAGGTAHTYNRPDVQMPSYIVSPPWMATALRAALRERNPLS